MNNDGNILVTKDQEAFANLGQTHIKNEMNNMLKESQVENIKSPIKTPKGSNGKAIKNEGSSNGVQLADGSNY